MTTTETRLQAYVRTQVGWAASDHNEGSAMWDAAAVRLGFEDYAQASLDSSDLATELRIRRSIWERQPTPKLDAEIDRVQRERYASGLHPLSREKAIVQLAAERVVEAARDRGMRVRPGDIDWFAWLIMEPVIENGASMPTLNIERAARNE